MIRRLLTSLHRTPPPRPAPAVLCDRKTFERWSEPDPWGWTLRGRFYGARGRFLGKRFCLGAEDLARGVVAFGWHATDSVLWPAIADRMKDGHSLVVTDFSGNLQYHFQLVAATTGHLLLRHDLEIPAVSCALNLCDWLDGAAEARAVAAVLLSGPAGRKSLRGEVWRRVAIDLVAACALHHRSLGEALAARQDVARLAGELFHSQRPGVADLVASLGKLAAKDLDLAHKAVASTLDIGLAPWAERRFDHIREISGYSSLDLASQLAHVPTVVILQGAKRQKSTHGPYLGALLQALTAHLRRIGQQRPEGEFALPVGLILGDFPVLGRLGFLAGEANQTPNPRLSVLAAAKSLAHLDPSYPDQDEVERSIAGLGTKIVFGGCDQRTAEFFSRLGRGLVLPEDLTGLAGDQVVIFAARSDERQTGQVVLHGRPLPFREREDWKSSLGQPKAFTVIARPLGVHPAPRTAQASTDPAPEHDPLERLLADAPESSKRKERDLWTNDNW
jgi:hypothetical protein